MDKVFWITQIVSMSSIGMPSSISIDSCLTIVVQKLWALLPRLIINLKKARWEMLLLVSLELKYLCISDFWPILLQHGYNQNLEDVVLPPGPKLMEIEECNMDGYCTTSKLGFVVYVNSQMFDNITLTEQLENSMETKNSQNVTRFATGLFQNLNVKSSKVN